MTNQAQQKNAILINITKSFGLRYIFYFLRDTSRAPYCVDTRYTKASCSSLKWLWHINFQRFVVLAFLCLLFNCKSDPYLYDKAGFDSGARPVVEKPNPSAPSHIAPDYYYRQPQAYSAPQGYAASQVPYQQPAPYYPQQQQYQAPAPPPYYQQPQQYQQQPYYAPQGGSRFYSNPYAIPPSNYYPNYDADQYYVPPAYIQNNEPVQQAPDRPKY